MDDLTSFIVRQIDGLSENDFNWEKVLSDCKSATEGENRSAIFASFSGAGDSRNGIVLILMWEDLWLEMTGNDFKKAIELVPNREVDRIHPFNAGHFTDLLFIKKYLQLDPSGFFFDSKRISRESKVAGLSFLKTNWYSFFLDDIEMEDFEEGGEFGIDCFNKLQSVRSRLLDEGTFPDLQSQLRALFTNQYREFEQT